MEILINDIIPGYKTPFRPVIVIRPSKCQQLSVASIPAVLLSSTIADSFRQHFSNLVQEASRFVVCWDEPGFKTELAELLIHAMFSTNYLFNNNRPVVIVRRQADQQSLSKVVSAISKEIKDQGFGDVEIWAKPIEGESGSAFGTTYKIPEQYDHEDGQTPLTSLGNLATSTRFISAGTRLTETWFRENLFNDLQSITGYLIIDSDDLTESLEIQQQVDHTCKLYLAGLPMMATALNDYRVMKDAFEKMSSAHKQVKERLAGAEKTIEVVRTKYKDDYENLFKWYHNEYEILPLWYKRFGHILKVLMGKRSFRSLFSDDVKKYKN